ncbi:hypothetical protein E2C01_041554 [Portunus trituberculatus]|uniref:Uncharacterized protein n=1 Tax=Portunus trituberculatus TaxID=210409 RepID=A0A5B7FR14_PORTR|nr:hypothetical protein [Portunus trituberculatus]
MSDGLLPSQNVSVGVSHKAPMLGNQTHVPFVGVGVCPSDPMPGGHPLPCSGVIHMDPAKSVLDSFPLFRRLLLRLADQLLFMVAVGEKRQLLSSPISDVLFDPAVETTRGDPFRPGVLAVADPMAEVDLVREVVCSPVPVGACLQRHWREWMEVSLDLVVQDMLAKGAIELVGGKLESFYARLFLVPKLGIQINLPNSDLVPSQRKQHLGMVLDSVRALVFPSPERVSWFLLVAQSFLEDRAPMVSLWRSLLGHLASLERLVPGSQRLLAELVNCMGCQQKFVTRRVGLL